LAETPAETVSPEDWLRLPLLSRADIQAASSSLQSSALPATHGRLQETFTSGTTGKPIRTVRSEMWSLVWSALTLRDHLWHRRDMRGKLAVIRESNREVAPYPAGVAQESWGNAEMIVRDSGPGVGLNVHCSPAQQTEWLVRQDPDYLLTFPTVLEALAEHCIQQRIRPARLKQVVTIAEPLQPEVRALCREAWGVPISDIYSTREVGYIALQCPEHEHYHVQSEGTLVEVLDKGGVPCGPGHIGRVVVTSLHNFAMPLIRYDLGDFAELGEVCPCGRGLPVLARIAGRTQEMLVLPSGERRFALLSSQSLKKLLSAAPIRQYQIVQQSLERLSLRLVVGRSLTSDEEDALRRWLRDKFGYPFEVTITYHEEIPRTAGGKFQDFVSEIAAPS
jgi:phenylacetate-CoA ligase